MENTSGQGSSAAIPAEIERWNWGAFLLNWIWGIGNKTYIALLMFLPGVNLIMLFLLGAKGSKWAWQNKHWDSVDHFNQSQKKWVFWGVIAWVLTGVFIIGAVIAIKVALKQSEPFKLAEERLLNNSAVVSMLGEPIHTGLPSGSIEVSGSKGKADISFSVEGSKDQGTVYLDAFRDFGAWKFNRIELDIKGAQRRLNLLEPPNSTPETGQSPIKIETAIIAQNNGDYATALRIYTLLADQGDPRAQVNLGILYAAGSGVAQDMPLAVKLFRKAAEQGLSIAQENLALAYATGRGVEKDYNQSLEWYRKAAGQGSREAQFKLGVAYSEGLAVTKNPNQALIWFQQSANLGHPAAQHRLGLAYQFGRGTPKDDVLAAVWYKKAADSGVAEAQNNLGVFYEYGRGGLPKDEKMAVALYLKAAENGYALAMANLGVAYAMGRGLPKDDTIAVTWFQKAADKGNAKGQFWLGNMYAEGRGGLSKDPDQAKGFYQKAASQGFEPAKRKLK